MTRNEREWHKVMDITTIISSYKSGYTEREISKALNTSVYIIRKRLIDYWGCIPNQQRMGWVKGETT